MKLFSFRESYNIHFSVNALTNISLMIHLFTLEMQGNFRAFLAGFRGHTEDFAVELVITWRSNTRINPNLNLHQMFKSFLKAVT